MTTIYHQVIFDVPESTEEQTVELCIIPRIGETVWLNGLEYTVEDVVNDIHKRAGIFGKFGMYINRIPVILSEEVNHSFADKHGL